MKAKYKRKNASEELMTVLHELDGLEFEVQNKRLESLQVDYLEKLANELYEELFWQHCRTSELLDNILRIRFYKKNSAFEWTDENKQKFLNINSEITAVIEKAYKEALETAAGLEERIRNGDSFIKDYEIEASLTLYMKDEYYDANEGGFGRVLSEPIEDYSPINFAISHSQYDRDKQEKPLYLDTSLNWNIQYFNDVFADDYIWYAIHELLDTHRWSFQDIIDIDKIWADVKVYHQYWRDIGVS
jgi:hypothetical protein